MHILLTGASGMVGQAALQACRTDTRVSEVIAVVREPLGIGGGKVREVVCADFFRLAEVADQLARPDACLYCAGVSSVGRSEADYRRLTYEMTLAVAKVMVQLNPKMQFLYVTGEGTDSSERGRVMWARVKGKTENALLHMSFSGVALFRPGYIQPLGGVRSKVGWYDGMYRILRPAYPLLRRLTPGHVTDSDTLGRAMVEAVQPGVRSKVYTSTDINRIGRGVTQK